LDVQPTPFQYVLPGQLIDVVSILAPEASGSIATSVEEQLATRTAAKKNVEDTVSRMTTSH
jgi:hypothetical protein